MNEEMRTIIALIAGAIVLVISYIKLFLKGRSYNQKFIDRAKAKGNYTTATLVDNKLKLGNDDSGNANFKNDRMKCTYEYIVNGTTYKKKLTFQSPGMVAVKFPYTVTVYYEPNNPSKSVCKEEATQGKQRSTGCFGTIGLAALTFIIIYNLLKLI